MLSSQPPANLHPAQRWYLAEDLVRHRRSDKQRRYAAPQRAAEIADRHQINAVVVRSYFQLFDTEAHDAFDGTGLFDRGAKSRAAKGGTL